MGLNFTLTDKLLKQMEDGKVAMLTDENWNEEGDAISYARSEERRGGKECV